MRVFRCDEYYQEAVHLHSLLCYGGIMNTRFKLYNVDKKYVQDFKLAEFREFIIIY